MLLKDPKGAPIWPKTFELDGAVPKSADEG